jgi:hypothetical protein
MIYDAVKMSLASFSQSILKDIDIKEVIGLFQPILEPQRILAHSPARRRRGAIIRVFSSFALLLAGLRVLMSLLLLPSVQATVLLGLGGRSVLSMQQVT